MLRMQPACMCIPFYSYLFFLSLFWQATSVNSCSFHFIYFSPQSFTIFFLYYKREKNKIKHKMDSIKNNVSLTYTINSYSSTCYVLTRYSIIIMYDIYSKLSGRVPETVLISLLLFIIIIIHTQQSVKYFSMYNMLNH